MAAVPQTSMSRSTGRMRSTAGTAATAGDTMAKTTMAGDTEALAAHDDGAILVFMSGTMEISKAMDAIKRTFFGSHGRRGGGRDGYDDAEDAYDGGGQRRKAPLMHPQAVRRVALQAVAQYEETLQRELS